MHSLSPMENPEQFLKGPQKQPKLDGPKSIRTRREGENKGNMISTSESLMAFLGFQHRATRVAQKEHTPVEGPIKVDPQLFIEAPKGFPGELPLN